jgi:hypothetical protein
MIRSVPGLVLLASLALGCASLGGEQKMMFPITAEQADKVMQDALTVQFGADMVRRTDHPHPGYEARTGILGEPDVIFAVRVPAKGERPTGEDVDGFAFLVGHRRQSPGRRMPQVLDVYDRVVELASHVADPLPRVND